MKAVKGVEFAYQSTPQTRELLSTFREMINDAIRICLSENIKGRLKLRNRIYKEVQVRYGVASCLPYCVAEVAWSIVKKHKRWHRKPFAKRLMFKMDAANFSLNYSILSLPFRKGERVLVPLRYGEYQRSFLGDKTLKRGCVTMTESSVVIAFSKEVPIEEPLRRVGYDLNEKSIVGSDGTRHDLSEVARLHTLYGIRRSRFYERHPTDGRLKRKFASSRREKERVNQTLHRVSTLIVEKARANKEAIVLERLKGIRYSHEKGNGEGKARRRRVAQWPFGQLQAFIGYKARWAGVPVEHVSPAYTSKKCNFCGSINRKLKLTDRSWLCPCGAMLDRDLNAAINIARRGKIRCLGEVRPEARGTDEAMKGNETTMAPIPQAEAAKSSLQHLP
ncbi:MAG: RNA-guided endonuclease TnpB family protein [Thaumarchaeota archaeon]|nr:RNA-guided endonuclease TnpB family protein [Nitrososphaerota archaeon]